MKLTGLLTSSLLFLSTFTTSIAQSHSPDSLSQTIIHHDSLFWEAYNACDMDKMRAFLTDDLEFYHDKGGLTKTSAALDASIRKGICSKPEWRLRREAIAGTVKVFPMNNIGALISGEHVFYIREAGREEYLDGYGKFMQLWVIDNGKWKMSRIISYDHGPAPYINKHKEITLQDATLKNYAGNYQSSTAGKMTIVAEGNVLKLSLPSSQVILYAETENKFFMKERDLQFEFISDKGTVTKVLVHEKGKVVDEAARLKK